MISEDIMKTTTELKAYLKELQTKITNISNTNAEMSVFAFSQVFDEETACFNYPSYRINLKTENIKEYVKTLLSKANSVLYKTSEIKEFNYNNNKTTIDFIDIGVNNNNTEKISNCLNKLHIASTESLSAAKKSANCLAVYIKVDNKDIYLFSKASPFVKTKQFVFTIDENQEVQSTKYDLKFPLSLSACIFDNEVYLFSNLIESIFGFENSLKEQMSDAMKELQDSNLFSNDSLLELETFSSKGKNYYCFNNYDKEKLNAIKTGNQYAQSFLSKYNIQKNSQGQIILDSDDKRKLMNKFLCNDLKRDYVDIDRVYDAPGNDTLD